jgi:hypothetical protein
MKTPYFLLDEHYVKFEQHSLHGESRQATLSRFLLLIDSLGGMCNYVDPAGSTNSLVLRSSGLLLRFGMPNAGCSGLPRSKRQSYTIS